ncbi:MAG: COX15/CtaA family protein, partial [Nitriliruptoraceae bacterium]
MRQALGELRPGSIDPLRGIRRLAVAATAATLLLIAMGGAVRATDSGLACPDWPACYGRWVPPADVNQWLEHSHRLWAGVVGLMITALVVWGWRYRRAVPRLWRLSTVALVLVLVQAGLGAAVVLFHLRAGLVTSHLGMSLVIVACLILVALAARSPHQPAIGAAAASHRRWLGHRAAIVAGLVFAQALLGGQATGRGAAYVYNAVPIWLADQAWTGHMREILHITHRFAGYLVAAAVIGLWVVAERRARRSGAGADLIRQLLRLAAVLVVVQVGLGISNVLTQATVWSAIAHLS